MRNAERRVKLEARFPIISLQQCFALLCAALGEKNFSLSLFLLNIKVGQFNGLNTGRNVSTGRDLTIPFRSRS